MKKEISQSQKIRNKLFILHQIEFGRGFIKIAFEEYYKEKMDRYLSMLNEKLQIYNDQLN